MKAVGCALLVIALAFVGFFAVVGFVFSRSDDQSGLTEEVDLFVGEVEDSSRRIDGRGWELHYTYEYDGQWYAHEDWIANDYWAPEQRLVACVDPEDPSKHVIKLHAQDRCGQGSILPGTATATPTGAPGTP